MLLRTKGKEEGRGTDEYSERVEFVTCKIQFRCDSHLNSQSFAKIVYHR